MKLKPAHLLNFKETLLVVTVIYFYGLAFTLHFGKSTYGTDSPWIFLVMGTLFLIALGLEALLAFWEHKNFLLWLLMWAASYGVIGLYVAPRIFGPDILVYVYVEPVIVVFIGGFAFAFGRVLADQLFPERRIPKEQLERDLTRLPGWSAAGSSLNKTFTFAGFADAMNFVNNVARIAEREHHHPDVSIRFNTVEIRLTTKDEGGITRRDLRQARRIDAVAM